MRDAEAKLSYTGMDTVWSFDRLSSIIINVQSKLKASHPLFAKRGLQETVGRKITISFPLL
jgi:hypothetical protein